MRKACAGAWKANARIGLITKKRRIFLNIFPLHEFSGSTKYLNFKLCIEDNVVGGQGHCTYFILFFFVFFREKNPQNSIFARKQILGMAAVLMSPVMTYL